MDNMKSTILIVVLLAACAAAAIAVSIRGQPDSLADNKVVCYYTNWASYREGNSKYVPSDIDPSLCTHIIYSFAELNPSTLTIQVQDRETDINQGFYRQVTALKERGVKVSIAIGGWSDSAGDKYSRMVSSTSARINFVNTVVAFLQEHNFDGLDLDWEYPRCWQADCNAGPASDKVNFANLVRELRAAFRPHGFLLSAAVAAARSTGDNAYDIPALSENLDWIGLMTYDFHGGWDGATGHNSPLGGSPPSTIDTVDYWLSKGAAANKLVLGVALYGRSFTLRNQNDNGVGAPATNGAPGQYTKEDGFLAYFEMCTGWTYRNVAGVGPYAYKGNQWVSYDDVAIVNAKADFVKQRGLAGAMVWAIDLDDFNGRFCGQGNYPLLKALRAAL
jgi:chitinase